VASLGTKTTPSQGMELLWDINAVVAKSNAAAFITTDLMAELALLEDSQWTGLTSSRGGGMIIARLLSNYGIEPRRIRIGKRTGRGYRAVDFKEAWRRYPPPKDATDATDATDCSDD
jgi:hypothetical protein